MIWIFRSRARLGYGAMSWPSFRVTAKPDPPFYLVQKKPSVEVRGEYLFGKPVASGTARITEGDDASLPRRRLHYGAK